MKPTAPQKLLVQLVHTDYKSFQGFQSDGLDYVRNRQKLKQQIQALERQKLQFLNVLKTRNQLKKRLEQLLNYRKSIQYDQKFKRLKFDHYQFPYRSNTSSKSQLSQVRLDNLQKRRKIRELQDQIKQKQKYVQSRNLRERNNIINTIKQNGFNSTKKEDQFVDKINNIKTDYLSSQQQWKRAKIKHDYNLMVQKNICKCSGKKVCQFCSNFSLQKEKNSYTKQALLSPRYFSIYGKRQF